MSGLGHTVDQQGAEPVRLGLPPGDVVSLFILGPVVGVAIGVTLPWVARWAADLPWAPFQGPLELVASWDLRWGMAIGLVAGLVLGIALAITTVRDTVRVTVAREAVTVDTGGTNYRVPRADVSAAFLESKRLVLLDATSQEVVRHEIDAKPSRIEQAFRQHAYPWYAEDPNAEAFGRWVADTPELPGSVNAVFAAREKALRERDAEDADDLRSELGKRGYVVRDEKTRQYWRPIHRPAP